MKGFSAWLLQRLTAVYMVVFIPLTFWIILSGMPWSFEAWQDLLNQTTVQLAVLLFVWALLFHAWIGLRDVIIDYLNPIGLRLTALSLVALFLVTHAIWIIKILWLS
jgi:succinate dehydrogenase / fumarate reductase membrane anchor subunit